MHMIGIINDWNGKVGKEWITSQWDLDHAPNPWARVKGPMGAAQIHFKEMQWHGVRALCCSRMQL
eukprot:11263677-Karenia_brevis.AAC.1